jgi:galactose mutarotase-like enzyme
VADRVRIASDALAAEIAANGAELQSLIDARDRQYMSSGDPAFWTGRAPLLFPIVGRLNNDTLRVDGQPYTLEKHGFARHSRFDIVSHDTSSANFRLTDSAATRAAYPFAFELEAHFALIGMTLAMTVTVRNPGKESLPASLGYHPAFSWPLPGADRERHEIVFECVESAPLRRITSDGLIGSAPKRSPVAGNRFELTDDLFADDALVWTELKSHRLRYGVPDGPHLDIAFPDTPYLGIWTKPRAAFVCIEPWAGHADPEGFAGDFTVKPGIIHVEPGAERQFRMTVAVGM